MKENDVFCAFLMRMLALKKECGIIRNGYVPIKLPVLEEIYNG